MTFDYSGYPLQFIQRVRCKDESDHLFTFIFKFFSPVTHYHYIINADYHSEDVFAIKFYCKKDRHSKNKFSKIVNKGDVGNILISCAKVVPLLLHTYPKASFGLASASTVDLKSKTVEPFQNNQRFRTYKKIMSLKFGTFTFAHFEYEKISSYLLVNRACGDVNVKERQLINMFTKTYETLHDVV